MAKKRNSDLQNVSQPAEGNSNNPVFEPDSIEELPKEVRELMVSMSSFQGRLPNPILKKVTSKHIDKLLEGDQEENLRRYKFASSDRLFKLAYILIGAGLFVFLTMFLVDKHSELYFQILRIFIIFAGGFGAGYGFKTVRDRRS